jgi:selenocysteine-specific translation elongation factor
LLSSDCVECAKNKALNRYGQNKDEILETQAEYRERTSAERKAKAKEYREKNKERIKAYREQNKEKNKAYQEEYRKTKKVDKPK